MQASTPAHRPLVPAPKPSAPLQKQLATLRTNQMNQIKNQIKSNQPRPSTPSFPCSFFLCERRFPTPAGREAHKRDHKPGQ